MIKLYDNGAEFLKDNKVIFDNEPTKYAMLIIDAEPVKMLSRKTYCLKAYDDKGFLLVVSDGEHSVVVDGDVRLAHDACNAIISYNLEIKGLLTEEHIADVFIANLEKSLGLKANITLSMHKMEKFIDENIDSRVEIPTIADAYELASLNEAFQIEALGNSRPFEVLLERAKKDYDQYRIIRLDNKIVAIAKIARENIESVSISCVYTRPEYRGMGLSRAVVGAVSKYGYLKGKKSLLYVDDKNPISNHLYLALGFHYTTHEEEISFTSYYKSFVVAGGCFWCMAKPYNEINGVIDVISGYSGGKEINPSYLDVKKQKTGHRECIRVIYNPDVISFESLLKIYFTSIDPFDPDGQFIDRGFSYSLALFALDLEEKEIFKKYVEKIEKKYERKVCVSLLDQNVFYPADEYHQDFAVKNKEAFLKEEHESHRDVFNYIELE